MRLAVFVALFSLIASTLLAHGKEKHGAKPAPPAAAGQTVDPRTAAGARDFILGTSLAVEGNSVRLRTRAGATTVVALTPSTRFERGHCTATRADLAAGRRVVIFIDEAGRATRVLVGVPAP